MKKKLTKKLQSAVGTSLAEMLVVLLIMSLVTSGIAGGATVVQRVYREVRLKADAQTLMATAIDAMNADLYQVTDVRLSDTDDSVNELYLDSRHYWFHFQNSTDTEKTINKIVNGNVFQQPIVTNKTRTVGLMLRLKDDRIAIDAEHTYLSYTIEVCGADGAVVESQEVRVRPLSM